MKYYSSEFVVIQNILNNNSNNLQICFGPLGAMMSKYPLKVTANIEQIDKKTRSYFKGKNKFRQQI